MSEPESSGLSENDTRASPWPVFVAVGVAISEVGVILAIPPVAVGRFLLFGGSVTGILRESGYISRPEWTGGGLGLLFLIAGVTLMLNDHTGTTIRGESIAIAGGLSFAAAVLWYVFVHRQGHSNIDRESQGTEANTEFS